MLLISSLFIKAQDSSSIKKHTVVKTIWDIPHKTFWQKWMWIHRSATFIITKDRVVNYDTAYIRSYYKRLVITLPFSSRFLQFRLKDFKSGNKLDFAPNLEYDLGISISSRWASFILNTGVKVFSDNKTIKGETKYQDYQLNLYGRRVTTDMFFQYYSGFYISNSRSYENYTSTSPYSIRSDVKAINMGVSSYYIINHKKFSYGNSFAFVEQQKKSAGSLLLGFYYSYFDVNSTTSLVNSPFRKSFDTLSMIRSGHTQNFGLSAGYIYTRVFLKKCYVTASFVQGVGAQQVVYKRDDNSNFTQFAPAGKLNVRLALGYDNGRYFVGTMGTLDYYLSGATTNSSFDYGFGKFMAYLGYRFSVVKFEKKLLHHFHLIDY